LAHVQRVWRKSALCVAALGALGALARTDPGDVEVGVIEVASATKLHLHVAASVIAASVIAASVIASSVVATSVVATSVVAASVVAASVVVAMSAPT
jgi:hypothetical protein